MKFRRKFKLLVILSVTFYLLLGTNVQLLQPLTSLGIYLRLMSPMYVADETTDLDIDIKTYADVGVLLVQTTGNFTYRVQQFNLFLGGLRKNELVTELDSPWVAPSRKQTIVWGARGDYILQLSNYSHVKTVALPWVNSVGSPVWNSLTDTSNVLIQKYYEWTADDLLCEWIETPGVIKLKYDAFFRATCERNVEKAALPRSLAPTYLNAKPLNPRHYWPFNGNMFPSHVYTKPPPFVFHLHIHRNAIVDDLGTVFSHDLKLVLFDCSYDSAPGRGLRSHHEDLPLYDEVFVIAQYWGMEVFHRMIEVVPRLTPYLDFLKANPTVRILAPEGPGGRLGELIRILGLDDSRLVNGTVRAKVVYQPRPTRCGFANVQESQILNSIYLDYIRRTFPVTPRNRLLLVRRTGWRRFTEQKTIEEAVERAARDFNLTYTVFPDDPTPSLNETMMMFQSSAVVVAPCGAGESNLIFSEPGTFVVEGVCNLPHVNLCFQRLASVLGMHWHGVPSRGGCEEVLDVPTASVVRALRSYLELWSIYNDGWKRKVR